jgi:hypothetical protein
MTPGKGSVRVLTLGARWGGHVYPWTLRMNKRVQLPKEALEFFRKQGRIGGHRRAANLSTEERSEQARKAAQARWGKRAEKGSKKKGTK